MSFIPERDFGFSVLTDYLFGGKGPLTCPTAVQAHAFVSTSEVKKTGIDWPDIQLYIFGLGVYETIHKDFSDGFGLNEQVMEQLFAPSVGKDALAIAPTVVRPKR